MLFTGLLWLVTGFFLKSLSVSGLFPDNLATHALTAGAIGVLTYGMMARVAFRITSYNVCYTKLLRAVTRSPPETLETIRRARVLWTNRRAWPAATAQIPVTTKVMTRNVGRMIAS